MNANERSPQPAIDELLKHLRFCFESEWANY
jgi:hypothetical protein